MEHRLTSSPITLCGLARMRRCASASCPPDRGRSLRPAGFAFALSLGLVALLSTDLRAADPAAPTPGTIVTLAGGGRGGFSGDGGPALAAQLNTPLAAAFDASGNLYIADAGNHRVRRIDRNGLISTVAGTGQAGYSGDNGPAKEARLNLPARLAFDTAANLYIGDVNNHCVRKVSPDGIITTVAGTGKRGFSGDGGPAVQARLDTPVGVTVDEAGNLYITDNGNNRVRRVDPQGTITTIAGTGKANSKGDGGPAVEAALNGPIGLTVDPDGNLLVPEAGGVRKIDRQGTITTVAGGGTKSSARADGLRATEARLEGVFGVLVDSARNLYLVEWGAHRMRKVAPDGTLTTVAGNGSNQFRGEGGPATATGLLGPNGAAIDPEGNLIIVQSGLHQGVADERVLKVFGVASPGLFAGSRPFAVSSQP